MMTDEQIIKDLHACLDDEHDRDCGECSQQDWSVCRDTLMKQCLDLINRQKKSVIERLRGRDEEFLLKNYSFDKYYDEHIKKAKSEAIKEFAERLKERSTIDDSTLYSRYYFYDSEIDNLVKEMIASYERKKEKR